MRPAASRRPEDDDLVGELRLAARASTPTAYRSGRFEVLLALAGRTEALPDWPAAEVAIDDLIAAAIAAIPDPRHLSAGIVLFGPGPERWTPLAGRQAMAGRHFGVGRDGYRRVRADGSSLYRETLAMLAASLRAVAGSRAGPSALAADVFRVHAEVGPRFCFLAIQLRSAAYREVEALAAEEEIQVAELLSRSLLEYRARHSRPDEGVGPAEGLG
jgi:hypothetical protein